MIQQDTDDTAGYRSYSRIQIIQQDTDHKAGTALLGMIIILFDLTVIF
jgi:hypothetical protein